MAASRLCLVRAQNDYAERQTKVSRCDADTCVIVAAGCRVKRRDNSLHDTMSIIGHERHLYGSVEHIPRMDVPQEGYNSITAFKPTTCPGSSWRWADWHKFFSFILQTESWALMLRLPWLLTIWPLASCMRSYTGSVRFKPDRSLQATCIARMGVQNFMSDATAYNKKG